MFVVMIGAPGSGKGTQARILSETFGLPHVSTGDVLRLEIAAGTELGLYAKSLIDDGNFVPDDVASAILASHLDPAGAVLDGYPRTIAQAEILDGMLAAINRRVDHVVHLQVAHETLAQRVVSRAKAALAKGEKPRPDDDIEILDRRLEFYRERTEPILALYRERRAVIDIDASMSIKGISQAIVSEIGEPSR